MQKHQFKNIVVRATLALIIPLLGQLFVKGWDWSVGEFVFAWIFFIILGTVVTWITSKIVHLVFKIGVGVLIIVVFAYVWVRLATG